MSRDNTVTGVNVGHLWGEREIVGATLDALMMLWHEGKIRPHVDRVFPLAEGPAAHRRMHERKNVGKISSTALSASSGADSGAPRPAGRARGACR